MSATTAAWLVLAAPLAGTIAIGASWGRLPGRARRVAGDRVDRRLVRLRADHARPAPAPRAGLARADLDAVDDRGDHGRRREADAARRPALGADDLRRRRGLDADPPLLDQLPAERPRLRALLRLPQLLRLLDAAARPRRQLRRADRRLGLRRRRLLHADQLLVPAQHGDERGHQGVRDQRRRRRRAGARHVLHLPPHRHARLREELPRRPARLRARQRRHHRGLPAAARRRVREVRADPAAHMAPGRDGGPDAGQRADPCRDDGDRRRLPDRPHAPALPAGARRRGRRGDHRRGDAAHRRDDRPGRGRPQARDRLLDDVADRLHDHGRLRRGLRRRPLPPDDARLLQGAPLHGGGLDDQRDGRRPIARPHVGAAPRAAVHVRLLCHRRPRAVGDPAVLRASSRRTRSCSSSRAAAAGTGRCTSPGTSARC